ncbi:MAG: hypothetical protein WAN48_14715 [Actinomycetes bacterium]
MSARRIVVLLVLATSAYLLLLAQRAWLLITSGEPLGLLLGVGVLILPVVGGVLVVRELRFGLATQLLAEQLEAEGRLPVDDVARRASGRVDRDAADQAFVVYRDQVERSPDDCGAWYALAIAYDDAGDRRRARAAMRRAIALQQAHAAD